MKQIGSLEQNFTAAISGVTWAAGSGLRFQVSRSADSDFPGSRDVFEPTLSSLLRRVAPFGDCGD